MRISPESNSRTTHWLLPLLIFLATLPTQPQPAQAANSDQVVVQTINSNRRQGWTDNEVTAAPQASDGEFARRVTLDVLGHIPRYAELAALLENEDPDRRPRFVERLLDDEDYVRNWTTIWGNLLVGRTNNQNGRQALDGWLRRAFDRNMPYDRFVLKLVSAEGTSQENPAVNFLASHLNNGAVPATAITARQCTGQSVWPECRWYPVSHLHEQSADGPLWNGHSATRGHHRTVHRTDTSLAPGHAGMGRSGTSA